VPECDVYVTEASALFEKDAQEELDDMCEQDWAGMELDVARRLAMAYARAAYGRGYLAAHQRGASE
jgi:hypothetical protein